MKNKFKIGDKVFHKNLEEYGVFESYNNYDDDSCFVTFYSDGYYPSCKCVSLNQLSKTDKNVIKYGLFN